MTDAKAVEKDLETIFIRYRDSFSEKIYDEENNDHDPLMDVFGISPELKRENRQYWGRELGMCWQLLVSKVFKLTRLDYGPALRFALDEPCDFTIGNIAIDTKYRIGSGDSGTLKKFKQYGPMLIQKGYKPVFLIVREDNLPAAITACHAGEWQVYTGDPTFQFIEEHSAFDLKKFLLERAASFQIER